MMQQVFPVQPEDGRFHVLAGPIPELPLVHVRMRTNEQCADVLMGATAYSGSLNGSNACVRGLTDAPPLPLVATLLSIAKTRARVMKRDPDGDANLSLGCTHKLELSCWDDEGVELALTVGLQETDAGPVVEAALSGLLRATGALEAVVKAIEMERTTAGVIAVDDKMTASQILDAATQPTVIKSKVISSHPAYRRYVARDVAQIGSRAYFCAAEAVKLGDEMRRVVDEKKDKDRRMRAAKRDRRKAMERARNESSGGVAVRVGKSKKQTSFFADESEEEEKSSPLPLVCPQKVTMTPPKVTENERSVMKDENILVGQREEIGAKTSVSLNVSNKNETPKEDIHMSSSQIESIQKVKTDSISTATPSQSEKKEVRKPMRKKKKRRLL